MYVGNPSIKTMKDLGVQKAVLPLDKVADMSIARAAAILAAKGPL
jgi:hypothetical protein